MTDPGLNQVSVEDRQAPLMRPPRPHEGRTRHALTRRRPVLRSLFFGLAALGGFLGGEAVLLALADPGAALPVDPQDRMIAFVAAATVALLGGLLCAACYRQISRGR